MTHRPVHSAPLHKVAEIFTGYAVTGAIGHDPHGAHQLLLPRHMGDGEPFEFDPEKHMIRMTLPERALRYSVQPGNVVFVSRGPKNLATLIDACPEPTVATSMFFVLRPTEGVVPGYLAWFLNQGPTQALIAQARTGSASPAVQRAPFDAIQVPMPEKPKQETIARLDRLQHRERLACERLAELVHLKHRAAGAAILSHL